ncbi:MAG: tRNA (adenosine(37)-N6)-threonylcarbamoyltransferase complex dimerization subunit type 1 TsaB [Bifidobacteriaceae bacterium]|jgi:tRNA threonylcarbamoyladenosine biosynthesis protein TsaB|nr:tRNA (adenosine(37)-N6)-threonylcarbamoyltransferase complex dimerization subunit type 1 TsaB [Bifidobacteriaceae bacterium]
MCASRPDRAALPVLGITAAAASAAGLWAPGAAPHRLASPDPRAHVESMIPLVRDLLGAAGLAPADLGAVAVGRGPAPYTGLRIGLATARTLGFALGIPVWGVCDLDVLAADAAARLQPPPGATLVAAVDAKRREVYWARYRVAAAGKSALSPRPRPKLKAGEPGSVAASWPASAAPAPSPTWERRDDRSAAIELLEGPAVSVPGAVPAADFAVGPGVARYTEIFGSPAGGVDAVDPVVLAELAWARVAAGQDVDTAPLYLRRPHVQAPVPAKRPAG